MTPEELLKRARSMAGMRMITITCIPKDRGNSLVYHFDDWKGNVSSLETFLPKGQAMGSLCRDFPMAGFYEREMHDMFDVEFTGNPRLHDRLFLPDPDNEDKEDETHA